MALAYTAPTWEDGSGTGISASQLQALCNCVEGLVQGTDKAVHNITFSGSTMTLTFADGSQETAATSVKGVSSITKTGSSQTDPVVDTYTITYSDGTTSTFQITNGAKGDTGATPVITVSATADAIASLNPTVNVTKSGTNEAPHFSMAFSGLKGQTGEQGEPGTDGTDGYSPAVTITNIPGGHRVNITDADHPTGQNFDVMNGDGAGDMLAQDYDSTSAVANAGGIPAYVAANALSLDGSNAADTITVGTRSGALGTRSLSVGNNTTASYNNCVAVGSNTTARDTAAFAEGNNTEASGVNSHAAGQSTKAGYINQMVVGKYNDNQASTLFEVGNGTGSNARSNAFEVYSNGDINYTGSLKRNGSAAISVSTSGTASSTGICKQVITIDGISTDIHGTAYMEQSVTLSTSGTTTATFTNAAITTSSLIDFSPSQWDLVPDDITVSTGSCVITLPQVDTAVTVNVRIYIK